MDNNEWTPQRLNTTSSAFWQSIVIHTAVKLDVFTHLGQGKTNAEDMAKSIKGNARALTQLLNALCAMGLIEKEGNLYKNTDFTAVHLSKDSPKYGGYLIKHHNNLLDAWSQMDTVIEKGTPAKKRASYTDSEQERENFLMGMFNTASLLAPGFAEFINLKSKETLLDLGGGPGTYAIHFCLKNPGLKATVYDLPTSHKFAEKTIKSFSLSDRITFQGGNYVTDPIEGTYDAAWLSHILHAEGSEICQSIIDRAATALNKDGLLFIHEFILNNDMAGPLFPALFSLNMLVATEEGQSYSEEQLFEMLSKAGLEDIERLELPNPRIPSGIIRARKG